MRPVSEAEIRQRCDVVDRAYGVFVPNERVKYLVPEREAGEKMFPKNTRYHMIPALEVP
jgi:hypothetical protein